MRDGTVDFFLHEKSCSFQKKAILVLRVRFQDQLRFIHGLVRLTGGEVDSPELPLSLEVAWGYIYRLREHVIGVLQISRLHLDRSKHAVGVGKPGIYLDGILQFQTRPYIVALCEKRFPFFIELHLLGFRGTAPGKKKDQPHDR